MTLGAVMLFAALCGVWRLAARSRGLGWFILAASACFVYLLQPSPLCAAWISGFPRSPWV